MPELSKIDHSCTLGLSHSVYDYVYAMKKELSPKQILAVRCPTCGAGPMEKCELNTGQPRSEPHRDRGLIAED